MRTLYFDTTNGIAGDMVLNALIDLSGDPGRVGEQIRRVEDKIHEITGEGGHSHHHHDHSHFHRSYTEVIEIIEGLDLVEEAENTAKSIYKVIAGAESKVHESPLDDLHFHEVGRNRAIANVVGVAICIDAIDADRIAYSKVCDGTGTVECAHGTLSVPVPAVKAMLDEYDVNYVQTDFEGEMVTPSGLAMLIGIGAVSEDEPEGEPVATASAKGARSADNEGLVAFIYE